MLSTELGLRPAFRAPIAGKICEGTSPLFGVVDMHRPCEIDGEPPPLSGVHVYYRRCAACGFLFTDAFNPGMHLAFRTLPENWGLAVQG
jgi:2-polyprenyl-6-hydroxyphenyl methylase/3-demethylubiquinone-9 3-methyltransferase